MSWLAELVSPLNRVLFHLGSDAVSWAELLGFITGGASVLLTVRRSAHNFWVGIANGAFFFVLFISARLWADAGLQVVFIALGFTGWWQWLHGGVHRSPLVIGRSSYRLILTCLLSVAVATVVLLPILRQADDIAPFWDALTTSLSLAAQFLLNKKKVENWFFWMAADLIYIPLYALKRLDLTAVVYVLFLGLCVSGRRAWQRELSRQTPSVEHTAQLAATR